MIIQKEDWNMEKVDEAIKILEPEIKVIVLDFVDPVKMADNFNKLGLITGNQEKAKEFSDYYTGVISPIEQKTSIMSTSDKPSVFIKAAGYSPDQMCTYGSGMQGWNSLLEICGGVNAASDLSFAFGDFDKEWIINKDIDVYIDDIWDAFYPETFGYHATNPSNARTVGQEMIDSITKDELFSNMNAVKNNRVFLINSDLFGTVRQVVMVPYMAKWLHPELFGDLNPEEIHQEYLNRFIGADYNLNEVVLFAYP